MSKPKFENEKQPNPDARGNTVNSIPSAGKPDNEPVGAPNGDSDAPPP